MKKLTKAIKKPQLILSYMMSYWPFHLLSDEKFIKMKYLLRMGKKLNLEEPRTFNEKLQWLKLNYREPKSTQLVDKYEVRTYIKETIGENYLIPLYGVYNSYEQIDFDKLPNQFVLKPNHTSGDVFICKDKTKINHKKLKKIVKSWLKKNFYWVQREWPYKNVTPKLIVEKYMVDESGYELKDYKFFCFTGEPKLLQVDFNRDLEHKKNLYDLEWNLLDFEFNVPRDQTRKIEKPTGLNEMIDFAKIISSNHPFVRVDFYSINDKIYFGEITFYPASGFGHFSPDEYDELLGSWITLPSEGEE